MREGGISLGISSLTGISKLLDNNEPQKRTNVLTSIRLTANFLGFKRPSMLTELDVGGDIYDDTMSIMEEKWLTLRDAKAGALPMSSQTRKDVADRKALRAIGMVRATKISDSILI
jgi:hypothetical protein